MLIRRSCASTYVDFGIRLIPILIDIPVKDMLLVCVIAATLWSRVNKSRNNEDGGIKVDPEIYKTIYKL